MKINYKNRKLILVILWRYERNNQRAHFYCSPPHNVHVGYSIHTFMKQPKSTVNSQVNCEQNIVKYAEKWGKM